MKCHVCGSQMQSITTYLPLKVNNTTIVIMKNLPVTQCIGCSAYLLDDKVLESVDVILGRVDTAAELEVIKYAA